MGEGSGGPDFSDAKDCSVLLPGQGKLVTLGCPGGNGALPGVSAGFLTTWLADPLITPCRRH